MAKNTVSKASLATNDTAMAYVETTTTVFTLPWTDGDTIDVTTIHPQGVAYLLAYGINKTGQDAASGLIAKVEAAHKAMTDGNPSDATRKAFKGYAEDAGRSVESALRMDGADFAREVARAASQARWAKVIAGEMDIPNTGNRLTGIARIIRDLAEAKIKANAKTANIKLTDDRLEVLVGQLIAGESATIVEIRAEAQRQMDAKATLVGADADVMALLKG